MNIIFLDIDGVLNYMDYFKKIRNIKINYNKFLKNDKYELLKKIIEIDIEKIYLLKEICLITNSKVVITSSWKLLDIYPLIEDYLINKGIPIIDSTIHLNSQRGLEIKNYLNKHPEITNYIIIDDDVFPDFDEELLSYLIHTNFYNNGINEDNFNDAIYKLKRN